MEGRERQEYYFSIIMSSYILVYNVCFAYFGYSYPVYMAGLPYYVWLLSFEGGWVLVPTYIHPYTISLC